MMLDPTKERQHRKLASPQVGPAVKPDIVRPMLPQAPGSVGTNEEPPRGAEAGLLSAETERYRTVLLCRNKRMPD